MGMIETRTRRGMILTEPTILGGMKRVVDPRILGEEALFDILGFRIALEIGICSDIFRNITPEDISELEEIVKKYIFRPFHLTAQGIYYIINEENLICFLRLTERLLSRRNQPRETESHSNFGHAVRLGI